MDILNHEASDWLKHFKSGTYTLAQALTIYLHETGAPEELREAYGQAISDYQDGYCADLAEVFGIIPSQRERKRKGKAKSDFIVRAVIDALNEEGFSKTHPDCSENNAFHEAGNLLNKSPYTLFDVYYPKK